MNAPNQTEELSDISSLHFDDFFFVKKRNRLIKINIEDIQCIRIEGRYSDIITENETFLVQKSLRDFSKILPKSHFKKIHRNSIVNMNKVEKIFLEDNLILLQGNTKVNMSSFYRQEFISAYPVLS